MVGYFGKPESGASGFLVDQRVGSVLKNGIELNGERPSDCMGSPMSTNICFNRPPNILIRRTKKLEVYQYQY